MTVSPTSVRLSADVDRRVAEAARRLGASKSEVLRSLIERELPTLEWEAVLRERSRLARSHPEQLEPLEDVAEDLGVDLDDVTSDDLEAVW